MLRYRTFNRLSTISYKVILSKAKKINHLVTLWKRLSHKYGFDYSNDHSRLTISVIDY